MAVPKGLPETRPEVSTLVGLIKLKEADEAVGGVKMYVLGAAAPIMLPPKWVKVGAGTRLQGGATKGALNGLKVGGT